MGPVTWSGSGKLAPLSVMYSGGSDSPYLSFSSRSRTPRWSGATGQPNPVCSYSGNAARWNGTFSIASAVAGGAVAAAPGGHLHGVVVVQAVEIQRLVDGGQVGVGDAPQRTEPRPGDQRRPGKAAQEDRVRVEPVQHEVEHPGEQPVGDRAGCRPDRGMQVRDADGAGDALRAQRLHGQAVAKELMVHRRAGHRRAGRGRVRGPPGRSR